MTPPPAAHVVGAPDGLASSWVPRVAEAPQTYRLPPAPVRFWRRLAAFSGPGYLVAVGYMDPGNWATDIAGGSAYGYALLSVVLLSSMMAMLLQALAAKLGVVTGLDLAQACRAHYSPPVRLALWLLCEVAIVACDLAEVIGTAIALQLLFGIPLLLGVCVTAADVFLVLALQQRGFRRLEAFVIALLAVIAVCFAAQLVLAQPSLSAVAKGFVPSSAVLTDRTMLYLAIGILGATVMPHNLYLHSSLVKARCTDLSPRAQREALRMTRIDSSIALSLAFFINAAILILSAATFHAKGQTGVGGLEEAYGLLSPAGGVGIASLLFGIALLASGQNSTVTGTLAGQIVMEGFLDLRMGPAARRLLTRSIAIVPAAVIAASSGTEGLARLLVLSQVVLSLQLPFAIVPLVRFTNNAALMGEFANGTTVRVAAWGVAGGVIGLNLLLLGYLL